SKRKIVVLLLVGVAFVALSCWLWSIADVQTHRPPVYVKTLAVAGVSLGALGAVYCCFKLSDTRAGLIIDEQGIVDNSNAVAAGRIFWHEVVGVKVSVIRKQRFVTILVADPKRFLVCHSFFGSMLHAANMKLTGSPINISSNSLRIRFDE